MNHVLLGLAANPALPREPLDRLIGLTDTDLADTDLASVLAERSDLSRSQVRALAERAEDAAVRLARAGRLTAADVDPMQQPHAGLALLDEGAGPPEWARLFAAHPVVEYREKLAACPGLPADVVETLAADPDVGVVTELALWAGPDTAARLARHPHAEVRRALASNENTPSAVLGMLITGEGLAPAVRCLVCDREQPPFVHDAHCPRLDCDLRAGAACDGTHQSTVFDTRLAAVRNPATPTEAVVRFADHPSSIIRTALAARPDLPAPVAELLARDPIPGVRATLAENPAVGEALIRVMADDDGLDVRRSLAHNPRVPLDVLTRLAGLTRIGPTPLPRVTAASGAEVAELAASVNPAVRMLVAVRRDLPAGVRDALAADADAKVAKSVAGHPGLGERVLLAMAARHGAQVAAGVAANPDATGAVLEELTRQPSPAKRARRAIAGHPRATATALLACLEEGRARIVAAGHPALPPEVVVALLDDEDGQVVEAAAANPSLPLGEGLRRAGLS